MAGCTYGKVRGMFSSVYSLLVYGLCIALWMSPKVVGDVDVSIDEEKAVGSFVTRLPDHDSIYNNLDPAKRKFMTYAILDKNNPPGNYFRCDQNTGEITVARRMDREIICDPTETCELSFNVAIQGKSGVTFANVITIKVTVNDINDNPPRFPARNVTLEVSETAKVGTELKISGAVDLDSKPEFTVRHYNSTPWQDVFSISPVINPDGSSTVNLRLERELDRETVTNYVFNIMAWDGGLDPRSDFMTVTVIVTDDNDNSPEFTAGDYRWTVNEDATPGTFIGQVTATDKDSGDYGRISYSFSQTSISVIKDVFAINATSGVVSLQGSLNKLGTSPFFMYVDARDGGDPPRTTQTLVSVDVLDSGNNAPVVRINTVNAGDATTLTIPESAGPDSFVAFVNVEDSDKDENGRVECNLMSGKDFKLNSLASKGYTLLLNRAVDREKTDSYEVFITCKDGGSPPLETSVSVTVNISDVNDNAPIFNPKRYVVSVPENRGPGHFVSRVTATDLDIGMNGEIIYALSPKASTYLSVQSHSGVISTKVPLDRETNATLQFEVYARDNALDQPRNSSATLVINVSDANDNAPTFNNSIFSFFVFENTPMHTIIGSLSAYDLDAGVNGKFEFFSGGSTSGDTPLPFTVLKNGSLIVSGEIDREMDHYYSFTAWVRDKGAFPKSNAAPVEINILDVNDNNPVIIFPSAINHSIPIHTKPRKNGLVLGQIFAYDVDDGTPSDLKYSIYAGNDDKVFTINATSGDIILDRIDRMQNPMEYVLHIKVEDGADSPRNVTTQLRIEVNFPNTTEPKEESSSDHYIIIVGVIGGATVVLSVIIISAIVIILRSEKSEHPAGRRHDNNDGSFFKNTFCNTAPTATTAMEIQQSKMVDRSELEKDQMDSTNGSNDSSFGLVSPSAPSLTAGGMVAGTKKPDDVQKKVSFSLDIENDPHHNHQLEMRGVGGDSKDMHLSPLFPSSNQWKKLSHPDDINSDTSGESGTCDSGRGTSDEDIKFDASSPNKGFAPHMPSFDPFLSPREIALHEFLPPHQPHQQQQHHQQHHPHHQNHQQPHHHHHQQQQQPPHYNKSRPAPSPLPQSQSHPHIVTSATPIQQSKPGYPVFLQTGTGGGSTSSSNYELHNVPNKGVRNSSSNNSISSSTNSFPVSSHNNNNNSSNNNRIRSSYHGHNLKGGAQGGGPQSQPLRHHNKHPHRNHHNNNMAASLINPDIHRPSSAMSGAQQGSVLSVDDDATTTTSGSYVINPDDVRVDAMLGRDVIV